MKKEGSGVDKVLFEVESHQLPAPLFENPHSSTRVVLFAYKEFKNLTMKDRIHACYFHASLKYITREYMTNASLRERLGVDAKNAAMITRIINEAMRAGVICIYDESAGAKARKYIPAWARS